MKNTRKDRQIALRAVTVYAVLVAVMVIVVAGVFAGMEDGGAALSAALPAVMFTPLLASLLAHLLITRGRRSLWRLWGLRPARWSRAWAAMGAVLAVVVVIAALQVTMAMLFGVVDWAPSDAAVTILPLVPVLLVVTCVTTFGEEVGWRGYARALLRERFGRWPVAWGIAAFWAAWHVPAYVVYRISDGFPVREMVASSGNILLAGVVLALFVEWAGAVWPAVVGHAAANTVLVYANSNLIGGTAGLGDGAFWAYTGIGWVLWAVAVWSVGKRTLERSTRREETSVVGLAGLNYYR